MLSRSKVILLSFFLTGKLFSSAQGPESTPVTLLAKSYAVQKAFLKQEEDYYDYLLHLRGVFVEEQGVLNELDPLHQTLLKKSQEVEDGKSQITHWLDRSLFASTNNIAAQKIILKLIQSAVDKTKLLYVAGELYELNKNYIMNRVSSMRQGVYIPSTSADKFATHDPINRQVAQMAIDRHASQVEMMKDAYTQMLACSPQEAARYIERLGTKRLVTRYVLGESNEIPDPTTSILSDFTPPTVISFDLTSPTVKKIEKSFEGSRKERRAAARKVQKEAKQSTIMAVSPASLQVTPSTHVRERIRRAVEAKRAQTARKEEDRALKIQKAREAREAFMRLREERAQTLGPVEYLHEGATPSSSSWVAPEVRVREKTRGASDPSYGTMAGHGPTPSSSSSSQDVFSQPLSGSDMKRLEAFWATKAGLTYHEVASLFKALGGTVSEKRGGSSHVTLSFYTPDGKKHKHELWRPHGSNDAFGFRTTAGLHKYFERCGLTLK